MPAFSSPGAPLTLPDTNDRETASRLLSTRTRRLPVVVLTAESRRQARTFASALAGAAHTVFLPNRATEADLGHEQLAALNTSASASSNGTGGPAAYLIPPGVLSSDQAQRIAAEELRAPVSQARRQLAWAVAGACPAQPPEEVERIRRLALASALRR
jgi:CheY-like chemotaxis protein